jgi:hypothetical protein
MRRHRARVARGAIIDRLVVGIVVLVAAAVVGTVLLPATPAPAHHVGTYVARDNEISANFKQLKFAIQARKFEVADRLFEAGTLRKELRARAAGLPAGLENTIRDGLRTKDPARAERGLMIFFVALARDLATDAERQLGQPGPRGARVAAGRKFLEAVWRYYNLVDFAVSQHDPKAAVAMRLAFDDAEGYARGPAAPAAANNPGPASAPPAIPADPERLRAALQQIARILTGVIDASSTARRES